MVLKYYLWKVKEKMRFLKLLKNVLFNPNIAFILVKLLKDKKIFKN